jgi:hypothetical protein
MAGAGRRSVERVRGEPAPCLGGNPGMTRPDGDRSPEARPVLGYILKGYPRISETFISNAFNSGNSITRFHHIHQRMLDQWANLPFWGIW